MSRKRRKISQAGNDSSNSEGWQIIYTGFVLILLCFFIMLCSFSSMQEEKIVRFVQSFETAISIFSGGISFESGKDILNPTSDIVDKNSEIADILEELKTLINNLGLPKEINSFLSDKGIVMSLSDTVLFKSGVAGISEEAIPILEKVGSIITKTTCDIQIEGHTDNLPIKTGMFPSNWELSTARAVNVLRYFLEKANISSVRLTAVGFGEFQPLLPNDTLEHRAKNRRVEIVFVYGEEKELSK